MELMVRFLWGGGCVLAVERSEMWRNCDVEEL